MKNRKLLMLGLAIIASSTIVGAGFSAWYFGSVEAQANTAQLGVVDTTGVVTETGKFTANVILPDYKLTLDQGRALKATAGIKVVRSDAAKIETAPALNKYESRYSIQADNLQLLNDAGYSLTLNYIVKVNATLLKYIGFDYQAMNNKLVSQGKVGNYYEYKFTTEPLTTTELNTTFNLTENTVFKWKFDDGTNPGKPLTSEAYTTMVNDLKTISEAAISFSSKEVLTNPNEK